MLYYPQYCVASVAITLVLITIYFLKQNYSTKQNKIFMLLIFDNLLASGINLASIYIISYPESYPLWLDNLVNQVYLLLFSGMAVLSLLYVDSIVKLPRCKKPVQIFSVVLMLVEAFFLFTSPYTHWITYFDENFKYTHGPYINLMYLFPFLAVGIALIMFILNGKRFSGYQVFSFSSFIVMIFASVVFQVYYPEYVISNFSCALMLVVLYSGFENPAYYLYKETRCYNRRAFLTTIKWYRKRNLPYLLVSVKVTNYDFMRHDLGQSKTELLISKVAEHLNDCYRKKVYNLNDDCFVIVLPKDADIKFHNLRVKKLFEEPFVIGNSEETITLPVSVMTSVIPIENPEHDSKEIEEIIRVILSDEKETATADDIDDVVRKMHRYEKLSAIIDNAVLHDGFDVYFQPIRQVKTGCYPSAEALIRLKDCELGYVSPEEFIPIAEKNGRIIEIGDLVFSRVCEFIKKSRSMDLGVQYIEVNLSPVQCYHVELARKFLSELAEHGLNPSCVNLEITETAELESRKLKILQQNLHHMNERGVTFSIDDFGSGFAAIDYLLSLPVSIVKIDKGILWQAMKDDNALKVLRGTMQMLKEIGKEIVVEGVETEEMAEILEEYGCDYMQGYLYSKPVPEEDYIRFLQENNCLEERLKA